MPGQARVRKPNRKRAEQEQHDERKPVEVRKANAEREAELDALVDEIDEVLIENASEFVREYKQKGGQ